MSFVADVMRVRYDWKESICLSVEQERTIGIVDGCPVHKVGVEVDIITGPELCTMYTLIDFLFNHQILPNRVVVSGLQYCFR